MRDSKQGKIKMEESILNEKGKRDEPEEVKGAIRGEVVKAV